MSKDKSGQGIVLDEKSQEQPKDKDRAQTAPQTEPGHMSQSPIAPRGDKRREDRGRKEG